VALEPVAPAGLVHALDQHDYGAAVLLLGPQVQAIWDAVRLRLVVTRTPVVVLTPLAIEPLRLLTFERELRVLGLHVVGFDDHPGAVRQSLERVLQDGILQRFLRHFGPEAHALEALILPVWAALASTRSVEAWGTHIGRNGHDLMRELRALGVQSPRRLLSWLRLLSAWPMLQAGAPAFTVAVEVGYSAAPALTRSARRFTGLPPSAAHRLPLNVLINRAAADLVA